MRQVILNFHGIGVPQGELEPGESDYWISNDFFSETLMLADQLRDQVKSSVTFDDGNLSDLLYGAKGLARYNMKATIFVLSSRIGQPGYLGPQEILELQEMGHEIGTHGADHLDWTKLNAKGFVREFETARTEIETLIGQRVESAAIPFGSYNGTVLKALSGQGYERVYSSDGGAWHAGHFPIPRNSLKAGMTVTEVKAMLLGQESLKRRIRRRLALVKKRWL